MAQEHAKQSFCVTDFPQMIVRHAVCEPDGKVAEGAF